MQSTDEHKALTKTVRGIVEKFDKGLITRWVHILPFANAFSKISVKVHF
ncbi:MAG: hypothetical protein U9N31_03240 [Candidatus Marinimicrobia bacterium]|nr:hypothetical protein [Candidatus Neomarinimicrobiota bacterium]